MGYWPLRGDQHRSETSAALASTAGATLTAGTANVKGAYVQLIASTAFYASGIIVDLCTMNAQPQGYLVDIAIGPPTETIIIPNLMIGSGKTDKMNMSYYFPISIPKGTEISARCQSNVGSATVTASVNLLGQGFLPSSPFGRVTTYGAVTADSAGTQVDPGGAAHTKVATEIVASTTNPIRGIIIALQSKLSISESDGTYIFDISVGGSGSELPALGDLRFEVDSNHDDAYPMLLGPFPCYVPAASRLAIDIQSSVTNAVDRVKDMILYGMD